MWWPTPPNKTPRFFQPCPGNDPYNLEPGMYGLVDVSSGSEAWYRPFRDNSGDAAADPIRIATAAEVAAITFNTLAELNTLVSDANLDDSGDPRDPNAHALGSAAHSADTLANLNVKISDADIPNNMSGASESGDELVITDGVIADSSDRDSIGFKDTTLLSEYDLSTTGWQHTAVGDYFIAAFVSGTTYDLLDKSTGEPIVQGGTLPASVGACVFLGKYLIGVSTTNLFMIDPVSGDLIFNSSIATASVDYIDVSKSGNIYFMDSGSNLYIYDISGSLVYSGAISGFSNAPCACTVDDDESYLYVIDAERVYSSGPDAIIRRIDLTTKTITLSSLGISAYTGFYAGMEICNDRLAVCLPLTGSVTQRVVLADVATLDIKFDSATTFTTVGASFRCGELYGSASNKIYRWQVPALTREAPDRVSGIGGSGVYSAAGLTDDDGNSVEWTKKDWGQSVLASKQLTGSIMGVTIESVVTSVPVTPVFSAYYLIFGGTSEHEGMVVYKGSAGLNYYRPYHGAKVVDSGGQYTYEYVTDRWVKSVDMVMRAQLSDGSSSGPSDIMTLDNGDTIYPLLVDREAWDIVVKLTAYPIDGIITSTATGKWEFDGVICYQGGDSIINNATSNPVNMTDLITSSSLYTLPTIGVNTSTGALEITVQVTDPNSNTHEWVAEIKGKSREMADHSPA